MKPLKRNQQPFWYANPIRVDALTDHIGPTGQFGVIYGEPQEGWGNFAPASGEKSERQFGVTLDYDIVLLPDPSCCICEQTVIWRDTPPPISSDDGSFSPPWTHEVRGMAESLNGLLVALRRVHVR